MNRKQRRAEQRKKFAACTQDHPGPYRLPTEAESAQLTHALFTAILSELQDPVVRELDTRAHLAMAMRAVVLLVHAGGAEPLDYFATTMVMLGSREMVLNAVNAAFVRAGSVRERAND